MPHHALSALGLAAIVASTAHALPTIEVFPVGFIVTDSSADGSVLVGNVTFDQSFEAFRYTEPTGIVRLGRATNPVLGTGAGGPNVSYDGTRVSATILTDSGTMATQGVWTLGQGWQTTMPPSPPGNVSIDNSLGSAWGLSGDGSTLTGFYWTSPAKATASAWNEVDGVQPLGQIPGRNARANRSNFDGSVFTGWEERPDGVWQPVAWRGGVKQVLDATEAFSMAWSVTADGGTIVGSAWDEANISQVPGRWVWNGSMYVEEPIGKPPFVPLVIGTSEALSISDSGRMITGSSTLTGSPAGAVDGWVWTPQDGFIRDEEFIDSLGLELELPSIDIRSIDGVSADGSTVFGSFLNITAGQFQTFVIRNLPNACPADTTTTGTANEIPDGVVDLSDFSVYLTLWSSQDPRADVTTTGTSNGVPDGVVDLSDFSVYLSLWSAGCP